MKSKAIRVLISLVVAIVAVSFWLSKPSIRGSGESEIDAEVSHRNESHDASIKMEVIGLQPSEGLLKVAFFAEGEGFPNHDLAMFLKSFEVVDMTGPVEFAGVLPGKYAIAVYHDLDRNGELNRALMGYPTEPYGFSNNARGKFGPPDYALAEMIVGSGTTHITIEIR